MSQLSTIQPLLFVILILRTAFFTFCLSAHINLLLIFSIIFSLLSLAFLFIKESTIESMRQLFIRSFYRYLKIFQILSNLAEWCLSFTQQLVDLMRAPAGDNKIFEC